MNSKNFETLAIRENVENSSHKEHSTSVYLTSSYQLLFNAFSDGCQIRFNFFLLIHKKLKTKIIFSTHNLVSDNSFNEFQLILCRNVIIYFDRELQTKVFQLFDNSLEKFGYLALGTKETLDFSTVSKNFERHHNDKIWRKIQ